MLEALEEDPIQPEYDKDEGLFKNVSVATSADEEDQEVDEEECTNKQVCFFMLQLMTNTRNNHRVRAVSRNPRRQLYHYY